MADYVKLANEQGVFFDPETRLTLSGDDEAELAEPIGRLTKERLRYGGLVRCKGSSDPASLPGEGEDEIPPDPPLPKGGMEANATESREATAEPESPEPPNEGEASATSPPQTGSAEPDTKTPGRDAGTLPGHGRDAGTLPGHDREAWIAETAAEIEKHTTVKELRDQASEMGLAPGSKDRKADLAAAIAAALLDKAIT